MLLGLSSGRFDASGKVLILIVLEDALGGRTVQTRANCITVLILIVLEDALGDRANIGFGFAELS